MCGVGECVCRVGVCVWGVCVRWFLASIGDMFRFYLVNLGYTGISPISSKGCIQYNWGYRVC